MAQTPAGPVASSLIAVCGAKNWRELSYPSRIPSTAEPESARRGLGEPATFFEDRRHALAHRLRHQRRRGLRAAGVERRRGSLFHRRRLGGTAGQPRKPGRSCASDRRASFVASSTASSNSDSISRRVMNVRK
jgi:hypothetical protein